MLQGINGEVPLYQVTFICFDLHFWLAIFLAFVSILIKKKNTLVFIITTGYFVFNYGILGDSKPNKPFINIGLVNKMAQYHPPLLFISLVFVFIWYFLSIKKLKRREKISIGTIKGFLPITISLFLSMWWANQELFWGDLWNWDPVEMSYIMLIILFTVLGHSKSKGFLIKKKTKLFFFLIPSISSVVYVTIRGPAANSVHQFTNNILMRIDPTSFYILYFIVILFFVSKSFPFFFKRNLDSKLITNKYFVWLFVIFITNSIIFIGFIEKNIIYPPSKGFFYKLLMKILILNFFIKKKNFFFYFLKNYKKNKDHLFLTPILWLILMLWNSSEHKLLLNRLEPSCFSVQMASRSLKLNLEKIPYNFFLNKRRLLLVKNGSFIHNGSNSTFGERIYLKYSNKTSFFNINIYKNLFSYFLFFFFIIIF